MFSRIKKFLGVVVVIMMFFALTGCDLYDPENREGITMNPDDSSVEKVDYLDGIDPEDVVEEEVAEGSGEETSGSAEVVENQEETEEEEQTTETTESTEESSNNEEAEEVDETESGNTEVTDEEAEAGGNSEITAEAKEAARDLNTEGFTFYQNGDYESALAKFKESMTYDDEYFFAHFNYACTLGVLMKNNYEEWYDVKDEVIEELKLCLQIDPTSKSKIMNDSDLDLVKSELDYLTEVAGYDLSTSDGVRNVLKKAEWYVHGQGVISVLGGVDFEGNNVTFSYLNLENFNEGTIGDPIISTGTYSYDGSVITFKMDQPTLKRRSLSDVYNNYDVLDDRIEFTGTLSNDGILTIDGYEYQFYTWYDEFSA